jgi:hypothetical protein
VREDTDIDEQVRVENKENKVLIVLTVRLDATTDDAIADEAKIVDVPNVLPIKLE